MSDLFDVEQEKLRKQFNHLEPEKIAEILEDTDIYGTIFFVPPRARWNEGFVDENGSQQPPASY